jgi:hypothetical protein
MTYVQAILVAYSPGLKKISITVNNYTGSEGKGNLIGTGFSGGVDSFCTLYDHFVLEKNDRHRINGLVLLNVGSHGKFSNNSTREKFLKRYEYLSDYTDSVNLPFIPVDSNIHYYHEEWGHLKTELITVASGILALQNRFCRYYVSSTGMNYAGMMAFGKNSRDLSLAEYSEPYLLPLLSTETLEFISDGQQYTRSEKVAHIAGYIPVKRYLNVCVGSHGNEKNCSVCSKCLRTQMTLESAGKLEDFSDIFDIRKYERKRFFYKCQQRVLYGSDPFAKDNIDFARKNKRYIPCLVVAVIFAFPFVVKLFAKKIFKDVFGNEKYKRLRAKLGREYVSS